MFTRPYAVRFHRRRRCYDVIDMRPHFDKEGASATLVMCGFSTVYRDAQERAERKAESLNRAFRSSQQKPTPPAPAATPDP